MPYRTSCIGAYFHFTSIDGWFEIQRAGILPYPLSTNHEYLFNYCRRLGLPAEGIYLWPKVTPKLVRDFAIWKFLNYKVEHGVLLEVAVAADQMLSSRVDPLWVGGKPGDKVGFRHVFSASSADAQHVEHHDTAMDIHLGRIAPARCRVVGCTDLTPAHVTGSAWLNTERLAQVG